MALLYIDDVGIDGCQNYYDRSYETEYIRRLTYEEESEDSGKDDG